MRAVQMLLRAANQGLIDPRSVSMIILVSDGDPTVGTIDSGPLERRTHFGPQSLMSINMLK